MQEKKQSDGRIIKTYHDLKVFQMSYKLANEIFALSKTFPKEETYSLTDQLRRASRSIAANIVEGWAKRKYENIFIRHLVDANGSCEEVKVFLNFAKDCGYITGNRLDAFLKKYNEVGAMLNSLMKKWKTF